MNDNQIIDLLIREAYLTAVIRIVIGAIGCMVAWLFGKMIEGDGKQELRSLVAVCAWIVAGSVLVWSIASAAHLVINPELYAAERMGELR